MRVKEQLKFFVQFIKLVTEYPDIFKCIDETDIDKTYSIPKLRISYRKPRKISEAKREQARNAIQKLNHSNKKDTSKGALWLPC